LPEKAILLDSIGASIMADAVDLAADDSGASEAARTLGKLGASKGGLARREALSPERRSAIAKHAVQARWAKAKGESSRYPKATHTGVLEIGDIALPCAVLEDGARVFTQQGLLEAIGRSKNAPGRALDQDEELPPFLRAKYLKPFVSEELERTSKPIHFRPMVQVGRVRTPLQ